MSLRDGRHLNLGAVLGRRSRIILASAVVAGGLTALALGTSGAAGGEKASAARWLAEQSGSGPFDFGDAAHRREQPVRLADAAPDEQWLNDATMNVYVGDVSHAKFGLNQAQTSRNGDEAWVLGIDGDGPAVRHYIAMTTPNGRTVWVKDTEDRPTRCG